MTIREEYSCSLLQSRHKLPKAVRVRMCHHYHRPQSKPKMDAGSFCLLKNSSFFLFFGQMKLLHCKKCGTGSHRSELQSSGLLDLKNSSMHIKKPFPGGATNDEPEACLPPTLRTDIIVQQFISTLVGPGVYSPESGCSVK